MYLFMIPSVVICTVICMILIYFRYGAGLVADNRWGGQGVVRLGGIGIVASVIISMYLVICTELYYTLFLVCSAWIFIIGLQDDLTGTSPAWRLSCELLISCLGIGAIFNGLAVWEIMIYSVWLTGLMNAFNFSDNMDGLLTSLSIVFVIGLLVIVVEVYDICLLWILLGSLIAFLLFNWHPATIYMGDCGSLFLGFVIGVLSLKIFWMDNIWLTLCYASVFLSVPIIDAVVVTMIRIDKGKSIVQGDTNHISHRLSRYFESDTKAVLILVGVQIIFLAIVIGAWLFERSL